MSSTQPCHAVPGEQPLHRRALRSVADDHGAEPDPRRDRLPDPAQHPQQRQRSLARGQAHHRDDARRRPGRAAPVPPARPRRRSRSAAPRRAPRPGDPPQRLRRRRHSPRSGRPATGSSRGTASSTRNAGRGVPPQRVNRDHHRDPLGHDRRRARRTRTARPPPRGRAPRRTRPGCRAVRSTRRTSRPARGWTGSSNGRSTVVRSSGTPSITSRSVRSCRARGVAVTTSTSCPAASCRQRKIVHLHLDPSEARQVAVGDVQDLHAEGDDTHHRPCSRAPRDRRVGGSRMPPVTRTIVSFHAHPDDEALLTAGTLARAAAQGQPRRAGHRHRRRSRAWPRPAFGQRRPTGTRRLTELQRSADAIGAARVEVLGYADSGLHGEVEPADGVRPFARADVDRGREPAGRPARRGTG